MKNIENKKKFIVTLHSLGKNESQLSEFIDSFDENYYILELRAPYLWFEPNTFAWFDVGGNTRDTFIEYDTLSKSIDYVINNIRSAMEKDISLDDPVFLGFSQGGIISLKIAEGDYCKVKGVFSICGYMDKVVEDKRINEKTKVYTLNCNDDRIIPIDWVEYGNGLLKNKFSNIENIIYDCNHELDHYMIKLFKNWVNSL